MPGYIRSSEIVCLDLETARNLLETRTIRLLSAAATEAEERLHSLSTEAPAAPGQFPPAPPTRVALHPFVDSQENPDAPRSCGMPMEWIAETPSGAVPVITGRFSLREVAPFTTQLAFEGACQHPPSVPGTLFGTAAGHRIAEISAQLFVRTIAGALSELAAAFSPSTRPEPAPSNGRDALQLIAENLPEVFWLSDLGIHDALYVSPAYDAIWGLPGGEPRRRLPSHAAFVHQEDLPRLHDSLTVAPPAPFDLEYRILRPDGSVRWIRNRACPVLDNTGTPRHMAGIAEDITRHKRSELELRQNLDRLQAQAAAAKRSGEEDRARVAREIHDQLGSALTGLKWDLEWLISIARSDTPGPKSRHVLDRLSAMVALTAATMSSLRNITSGLRAPQLGPNGLVASIDGQLAELHQRSGIQTAFLGRDSLAGLSEAHASAVHQIVAEALTNVLRHAKASSVEIRCWQDSAVTCISIADNGIGLHPPRPHQAPAFGILGMKERARIAGGTLEIPASGTGTQILVRIPLE